MNIGEYLEIIVAIIVILGFFATLVGAFYFLKEKAQEAKSIAEIAKSIGEGAQKDVDDLRTRHEGLDSKIIAQLSAVRESLARLEGRLGITNREGD